MANDDDFRDLLRANPWELYASKPGWQDVAARLDKATAEACAAMDAAMSAGTARKQAAQDAFRSVLSVMDLPENEGFGAGDSEPRDHLGYLIGKHLKDTVFVDRFGGVAERT